ncbi:Hpt domain-containing protein [Luteimonas sp. TWI596]|uniref:hybrid sensor histidine kinase/response regulator n=1 Tax=Luteimonas sp. TWI596 TaxID=3136785 RepID=UPI0032087D1B
MSGLREAIDHTMLGWIKPELDEVLRQARMELERFVEAPDDGTRLHHCATGLRQATGTLRMVELQAPALVVEEMERLVEALRRGEVGDRDAAASALLRGLLLLPDYLERLQGGHRDIPIVLLPLLNDLRAARGISALHERLFFDVGAVDAPDAEGEDEAPVSADTLAALREAFGPGDARPSDAELDHARSSLAGRNRALLGTVTEAVKDELLQVKDALDLHLRTGVRDPAALRPQSALLATVADTLGMVGLDDACAVVVQQREALDAIVDGAMPADEAALLDIAGALLYVDATLDMQVAQLGDAVATDAALAAEAQRARTVAIGEAIAAFGEAREALVVFVDRQWDRTALLTVPDLLVEVAGALAMLDQPQAAACLEGVRLYVDRELLAGAQAPAPGPLDAFADAVASLESFLQGVDAQRPDRDRFLEVARSRLQTLGYWPLPGTAPGAREADENQGLAAHGDGSHPSTDDTQTGDGAWVPAGAAQAPPRGGFAAVGNDIDDEIREIFLEELADEIAHLEALLPQWRRQPGDPERLRQVRRVFHTLKGNGRLVGAVELGEFAWRVESLLNRVIDGLHPGGQAVVAAVDVAAQALPALDAALRDQAPLLLDVDAVAARVAEIAAGDAGISPPAPMAAADAVRTVEAPPAVEAVATVPARIDALLLEILDAEANEHLLTVDAWIDAARAGDAFDVERLLRALHTMHGAFAMAEVPAVGALLAPAEDYARRLVATPSVPDPEAVDAIDALRGALRETLTRLHDDDPRIAVLPALAARLGVVRDRLDASPVAGYEIADFDAPIVDAPMLDEGDDAAATLLDGARFEQADVEQAQRDDGEGEDAPRASAPSDAAPLSVDDVAAEGQARAHSDLDLYTDIAADADVEQADAAPPAIEHLDSARRQPERASALQRQAAIDAEVLADERHRYAARALRQAAVATSQIDVAPPQADVGVATSDARDRNDLADVHACSPVVPAGDAPDTATSWTQTAADADADADADAGAHVDVDAERKDEGEGASDHDPEGPLDLIGLDPELIDIFVEEGIDLLDDADGLVALLRDDPGALPAIAGLQRDLHTLKGGARMAGLMPIGDLGHAMETLLETLAEQHRPMHRDDLALLEQGFDRLHAMLVRAGERRAIGPSPALVDAFTVTARSAADASGPLDGMHSDAALMPLSAPLPALALSVDGDDDATRGSQEQVRIRAGLLDRLVTYAGEVAIYRARLEQQLGTFRGAMLELGQTNDRLRDQLRRLDIETEAQIVARYRREGDSGDIAFDPLELDRFSTLQQLSRALGETAADLDSLQHTLDEQTRHYESLLQQQSRVSSDLQEGLMRTRMVPFDGIVPRLRRVVRQAAQDTGKQVDLHLAGAHGEIDRNVLERMGPPLEHLLRNAVAHGLETPQARQQAGKPEVGAIRIALRREGAEIVLEVADDGTGLDRAAIRRRAHERGLLTPDAQIAERDLDALILQPGFTTASALSHVAGRGVGLDVVASEVRQLGGSVDIQSRDGVGSTFVLRLPQTLAVTQAAFVRIGETTFAVPIASVRGVGRIARDALRAGRDYRYGDEDYALHDLGRLVGQAPARAEGHLQMPLLLIRAGELRAAVAVDEILGNREIVVKPVGPQLTSIPGIFGATIMGDGRVVVILDIAPLVRRQAAQPEAAIAAAPSPVQARRVPLVLVVDDSITMRKVTCRALERQGLAVATAKDGIDALERMDERIPDLVLLDIEMPRMDGYELAMRMKADPRLRALPIMMITSRSGDKHRERALEIGVDRYLGKPYQETELLRHVQALLGLEPDDA